MSVVVRGKNQVRKEFENKRCSTLVYKEGEEMQYASIVWLALLVSYAPASYSWLEPFCLNTHRNWIF